MTLSANSTPRKKGKSKRFPLTAHRGSGQWLKKINGKQFYFGVLSDPDAALKRYLAEKDDLAAGRKPRDRSNNDAGVTTRDLANKFLTFKQSLVDSGELATRTFKDYHEACAIFLGAVGKDRRVDDLAADDFRDLRTTLAKGVGPVALANRIRHIRMILKFAYDSALIDRPVRYGQFFNLPRKQILRANAQEIGSRMLEAEQIRVLLDASDPQMRCMILLGVNCGFGNHDVGQLPRHAIDLDRGWIDWPRPKTSVERRCPLWQETIEALQKADKLRVSPKTEEDAKLVFLTRIGNSWHKDAKSTPLSREFRKLLDKTGIYRRGLGFYSLRRSFETIGGDSKDQVAVDRIMGHADQSMAGIYRQYIEDDRLVAVANHVRIWLFGDGGAQ